MRKKDYIQLAAALRYTRPFDDPQHTEDVPLDAIEQWNRDRSVIANVLALDNPTFDLMKFDAACLARK